MSDKAYIENLPPEILYQIFSFLPVKSIMRCRAVSVRWKEIVEQMTYGDFFWERYCAFDFKNMYKIAREKCRPDMNWADIYRTLSLWPRLCDAAEDRDEFCSAASVHEEIKNIMVLPNGVISVHKQNAIVYYNIETFKLVPRYPITGNFLRNSENKKYIVMLNSQLMLYVIEKIPNVCTKKALSIPDVKDFVLVDHGIYHIDLNDNVYITTLNENKLDSKLMGRSTEGVMAVGSTNNNFHILTFEHNIFTLVENRLVLAAKLGPSTNLMHVLYQYNLLEMLDWRIYHQWVFLLNQDVPSGPLQDTILTRVYGDIVFVGSNWGVLRIYYKPYILGQLDVYHSKPIKQYNFMERSDCPVLSTCPILNVDVYEIHQGHIVIVAMPKKVALLRYSHAKKAPSDAMPLNDTEPFKILRTNEVCPTAYRGIFLERGAP